MGLFDISNFYGIIYIYVQKGELLVENFLGLLIADGNVFKDATGRQASISITLDLKDEYMLLKFKLVNI